VPPGAEKKFCPNCGTATQPAQVVCTKCGTTLAAAAGGGGAKSKVVAGLLGILLGSLGIHKFYLGYTKEGVIMLVVSVVTCGFAAGIVGIIGLVEGIMYLTKTDEDFEKTYVQGRKPWF
jgi:TM2 domain-containing membrane protein YozV